MKMKKVFVGLSGGVDSSVSAYLLKKAGYDVTGVFIKAWYPDFYPCNWRDEMRDAMRVCAKLKIPYLTCDLEKEYKKEVIDYLVEEYSKGNTPNPDVMCNKYIKFDGFLNFALEKGADYVATGHYAKKVIDKEGISELVLPKDADKDQTYFLWTLTQEKLQKILFPLGDLKKEEVRKIASKNNLHTATKKDSQGLCFIGHVDIKDFLNHFLNLEKGDVLNLKGEIIGHHDGALVYTIGQRHGFYLKNKKDNTQKLYVISKNIKDNTITVSDKLIEETNNSGQNTFSLKDVGFTRNDFDENLLKNIEVKIRYRAENIQGELKLIEKDLAEITFKDLPENIAKGQSMVFYKDNQCLGGGIVY